MPPEEFTRPLISIPGPSNEPFIMEIGHWLVAQWPHVLSFAKATISFLVTISIPISVFLLIAIIYCVEQLKVIRKKEKEKHDVKIEPAFEDTGAKGNKDMAIRWQKVNTFMNSQNQNDWRQAILEADNMLLDMLVGLGYQGAGVGEMLKRVEPGEFKSLQDAWAAHLVRNKIAHESDFALTHHEAVQTVHKFRRVFEEFYYI